MSVIADPAPSSARIKASLRELARLCGQALSLQARRSLAYLRSGNAAGHHLALWLVLPLKRTFYRIEGYSLADARRRFPDPVARGAVAPPPPTPVEAKTVLLVEDTGADRAKPPVARPAPRRSPRVADSVLPPNIERVASSQLQASHKTSLGELEMMNFLTAFGVPRADATTILASVTEELGRKHFFVSDLLGVQLAVGNRWLSVRTRNRNIFERHLREQLDIEGALDASAIADILVSRGYSIDAATAHAGLMVTSNLPLVKPSEKTAS